MLAGAPRKRFDFSLLRLRVQAFRWHRAVSLCTARSELASCASGRMARSAPTSLLHVHEGVSSGVLAGCSGKTTPLQLIANRACARSEEQDD